jgi:hypothetical protein
MRTSIRSTFSWLRVSGENPNENAAEGLYPDWACGGTDTTVPLNYLPGPCRG